MKDSIRRIRFVLGMAQKAGKLVSGDFAVKTALKTGKVKMLVIAEDAAENTKKELKHLAETVKVEVVEILTAETMGTAIGKERRVCGAFLDDNFTKMLRNALQNSQEEIKNG